MGRASVRSAERPGAPARARRSARRLGALLAAVLLLAACGPKQEIVYVDRSDHAESRGGGYTPLQRSRDLRVHADGHHEPAAGVAIAGGVQAAPYAPIGASGSPLVHAGGRPHPVTTVTLAHERSGASAPSHTSAAGAAGSPASAHGPATSGPAAVATGKPEVVAQPAPSPTPPARLRLGPALGAVPGGSAMAAALAVADEDDELATVAGRIESVVGSLLTLQTEAGPSRVRLADGARVERDRLGTPADLRPGQFVGVLHAPGGPAATVRLYAIGPSMPAPGVVPMVGSRVGQVTTFGSIVALQFGGLLLNAGSVTTSITLPSTVEILKPAPVSPSAVAIGAQIIAMGPVSDDGVLDATAVRVTATPRPSR